MENNILKIYIGNSLVAQWLGLCAFIAKDTGSIPGQGTKIPQRHAVWTIFLKYIYDLNQIHYNYTVEMTIIFNGLDLLDKVSEEQRTEVHNTVQEAVTKTIPKKKKC